MNRNFLIVLFLLFGCINPDKIREAKANADQLIEKIETGNIIDHFPNKFFSQNQISQLVDLLRDKCNFINRKGGFKNDFYEVKNGEKKVSFIYEYYMECDSLRLILTYNLGEKVELSGFKVEQMKNENKMLRD